MRIAELLSACARLRSQGRWTEALAPASAALDADPVDTWRRGFGYEERRSLGFRDAQAEWRAFEDLRRRRPQDAAAAALAGLSAPAAGRFDEGREALSRAGRLGPREAAPWARGWAAKLRCWQAEAALRRGETAAAFAAFDDAARRCGGASWALAWRAQAALWCGLYAEADALLARALRGEDWSLGRRSWAVGWRGLCRLKMGDHSRAARDFAAALREDPRDAEALAGAAEAALALGRRAEARRSAERLAALDPGSPWPGVVRACLGEKAEASQLAAYRAERCADPAAAFALCAGNRTSRPTAPQKQGRLARLVDLSGAEEDWLAAARAAAFRVDPERGWTYAWSGAPLGDARRHARLAAALAAAARRPGARAEHWAWRGELLRKLGREAEALVCLERALALDPAYAPARAWRGEALRGLSRHREARAELAAASAALPEPWVLALEARAWTDFTPEHLARALELYGRALSRGPCAWIRSWRGEALRRLRRYDEAAGELSWAAENGAPVAWSVTVLAEVERKRGRLERAAELLDFAQRTDAAWPWVHVTRSELSRKRRRYEEAIACLRRAARASGNAGWSLALLGRAQAVYRYKEEGLADLGRALRRDPLMGWAWAWRGETRRRLGLLKGARADLDRAIALDPDYPWAWAWRGGVRRQAGDDAGARADLDEALRLQENYPWAFAERARAKRALGDLDGSFADLAEAARRDPKHRWVEHPSAARAAVSVLERAARRRPRDARLRAWLGQALLDAGDAAAAERELARAVASLAAGELRGWARAWLGEALLRQGRAREALSALRAASGEAPRYAPARALAGGALALLGRRPAAEAELTRALALDGRAAWSWAWRAELRAARGATGEARADLEEALNLDPKYESARALARSLA